MTATIMRSPHENVTVRASTRTLVVSAVLTSLVVVVGLLSITITRDLPPSTVASTLTGHGTRGSEFLVYGLRMPRLLCAVLVGLALGAGGALFQSLLNNPLGSPDIVGFTEGASAGAVVAITLFQGALPGTAVGAAVGALVTAAVIYALSSRRGTEGYRLVLVGIAVSLMLQALVNYLLTRVGLGHAQLAQVWLTGSLDGSGWPQVWPGLAAVLILLPLSAAATRRLALLEMGDEAARALGVNVARTRLGALLLGVGLVTVAALTAGPIGFVALAAPQIARRLTRSSGVGLLPAALTGALVLVLADWAAHYAFGAELPVGVATGAVGGIYLAWLLSRKWRSA